MLIKIRTITKKSKKDKLSSELKLLGMCVGRGSIEKSGWAVIYVTSNDVMRTICLGDNDKWWSCYLRKMERERWRERLNATQYITTKIHHKITSTQ